jgi:MerR family transcriptional regulator, copper efflux regulator
MHQDSVTVGEAARLAGLSAKAVRLYEAIGILAPVARTPSGYRTYTPDQVELLRFVRRARALGLSLGDIQQLVAAGRHEPPPHLVELLERQVRATQARMDELMHRRDVLSGLLERAHDSVRRDEPIRLCKLVASDCGNSR